MSRYQNCARRSEQGFKPLLKKATAMQPVIVTTSTTNLRQSSMNPLPLLLSMTLPTRRQLLANSPMTSPRHHLASASAPYPHPSLHPAKNAHRSWQHQHRTPKLHCESEVEKHQPSVFHLRISHKSTTSNCRSSLRIRGFAQCTSFMLLRVLIFFRVERKNTIVF